MSLADCKIIPLVKITDSRGDIGVVEAEKHIPFPIRRIYYSYNVPTDVMRGGHGHKKLQQLMILTSGSVNVLLDDGVEQKNFFLNRPDQGLYIAPMIWRELREFSGGAVVMVLASEHYDEDDYFREYDDFIKAVRKGSS